MLDEEIGLAAAGNTDVGRCRVEEVGTDMVGEPEGTVSAQCSIWPVNRFKMVEKIYQKNWLKLRLPMD